MDRFKLTIHSYMHFTKSGLLKAAVIVHGIFNASHFSVNSCGTVFSNPIGMIVQVKRTCSIVSCTLQFEHKPSTCNLISYMYLFSMHFPSRSLVITFSIGLELCVNFMCLDTIGSIFL